MKQRLIKSLTMQLCAISAFVVVMASAEIAPAQPHGYIVLHDFMATTGPLPWLHWRLIVREIFTAPQPAAEISTATPPAAAASYSG